MKKILIFLYFLSVFSITLLGQFNESIETNWDGVTAKLAVCQQDGFRLYVQVIFENSIEEEMSPGIAISFKDIYLVDPETDTKVFILKDADGIFLAGPVSDLNDGGRWWINVPAKGKRILWAMFPSVSENSALDVVIPKIFPFEGIEVGSGSFGKVKTHQTNLFPAEVSLISTRRSSGSVSARMRLVNETGIDVEGSAVWFKDAYLFDFENGRKYPVLKDSDGIFIAEPMSDQSDGGRWWPSHMNKEGKALLYLKFQAPPDLVANLDIVIPSLVPFLNVSITGKSGVTAASGIEVRGLQTGIKRVLKDLQALETEEEIRIMLSSEILFDFDSHQLGSNAESVLSKVLQVFREYPKNSIVIEGHTDSKGTDSYNQELSEKRAMSVKTWFTTSGMNAEQIKTIGYGETKPSVSNDTDEGRSKNRRVEITIKK
jgi:outer membrane protein OmpA-like peptidoglycan-associated protein